MLDDELLALFMDTFLGYGNLDAGVWFIGMEEGGGRTLQEVQARLDTWHEAGQPSTADVAQFHEGFGQAMWFQPGAPTQSTWRQLIRAVMSARDGLEPTLESVREYQAKAFGRANGQIAALELMPLPSPSIDAKRWQYGAWSALPTLTSRAAYLEAHRPLRIQLLQNLMDNHGPAAVVCYGAKYQVHWETLCNLHFGDGPFPRCATRGATLFMLLPHPISRPSNNVTRTWLAAGERLRAHPGVGLAA